ncbi:hypothetical protein MBM_05533 [Drepanopeziza brunnea f. sp. 'multigermtubi' MB_m1]|uniref:Uncharacterized protein n=1 Tax=Marssonina brunnea f. sp. multigermtubi (strain MB_m1) TaxID=1072389 RepID=K1XUB0_MARBU|nr:uncharacterized protein MBM_05533 [Drepanopeziza brunnea f. sp. 'multigermtubi' MB_m1]EKD16239.1 hypothetical protein MBM_05533 [Drepanopeziza brunnea f. sp. 'multigermtubi' MB_m1]
MAPPVHKWALSREEEQSGKTSICAYLGLVGGDDSVSTCTRRCLLRTSSSLLQQRVWRAEIELESRKRIIDMRPLFPYGGSEPPSSFLLEHYANYGLYLTGIPTENTLRGFAIEGERV